MLIFLVSSLVLFYFGLNYKETNTDIYYAFEIAAVISFVSGIIFIACNFKKLILYDAQRLSEKIKKMDFSVIDMSINEDELSEKLQSCGYSPVKRKFYKRTVEAEAGDGVVWLYYYAAVIESDKNIDIPKLTEKFTKGLTTLNIGYVFINENFESNLDALKNYITETIVDVDVHRYSYKKFFSPIIICNGKIYYIKAGSFISEYKKGIEEGLRVLNFDV